MTQKQSMTFLFIFSSTEHDWNCIKYKSRHMHTHINTYIEIYAKILLVTLTAYKFTFSQEVLEMP